MTDLLAPAAGVGEDLATPRGAASTVAFSTAVASSATFSSAAASVALLSAVALSAAAVSGVTFFAAEASVTSLSAAALETAATSPAAPDVPGAAIGEATADEPSRGMETAAGPATLLVGARWQGAHRCGETFSSSAGGGHHPKTPHYRYGRASPLSPFPC
jgi:hypothetical protein